MVTALTIIVIILISSGSRMYLHHRFRKQAQPHIEALERASRENARLQVKNN